MRIFQTASIIALLEPCDCAASISVPRVSQQDDSLPENVLAPSLEQLVNSTALAEDTAAGGHGSWLALARARVSDGPVRKKPVPDHPLWDWNFRALVRNGWHTIVCGVVLFLSGILCAAGGIGGGGIYVSVLMVFGGVSTGEAVPLSKAIVFMGSVVSLVMNMRKIGKADASKPSIIDYNVCRLVVPSALMGTLVGVFLNREVPDAVIIVLLIGTLVFMLGTSLRETIKQYIAETATAYSVSGGDIPVTTAQGALSTSPQRLLAEVDGAARSLGPNSPGPFDGSAFAAPLSTVYKSHKGTLHCSDVVLSLGILFVVIICGTVRFHAERCHREIMMGVPQTPACTHPLMIPIFGKSMYHLMSNMDGARAFMNCSLALPIVICCTVVLYNGKICWQYEGWNMRQVMWYEGMAMGTGVLAGLVGIGGGLVFSPFFLSMGLDPAVAVATSSTCVIFTSSSTAMQYLLADRIIMTLMLVYGVVNLIASYAGTSLVHWLHDKYAARKSYISAIVCMGLIISTALSTTKLFRSGAGQH